MYTENYIKMCEKSKEIQCERILGRYDFGDLYYLESGHKHGGKFRFIGSYDGYDSDKELIEKSIWLPTQEQLWEMMIPVLKEKFKDLWDMKRINIWMIRHFINFMHDVDYFDSLNEFLLAFVAKEKYQKIWNGETWIKG